MFLPYYNVICIMARIEPFFFNFSITRDKSPDKYIRTIKALLLYINEIYIYNLVITETAMSYTPPIEIIIK